MDKIRVFKKNDIIIIIVLLLIAAAGLFVFHLTHRGEGKKVSIMIDGEIFAEYDLNEKENPQRDDEAGFDAIAGGEGFFKEDEDNLISDRDSKKTIETSGRENDQDFRRIEIPGTIGKCFLVIRDGEAYMESADCPNQICVHHKAVSHKGETIVCLPNRVIIEIL